MSGKTLPEVDFDDLTPIEIPYKIGGKRYILREAKGSAGRTYANAKLAKISLKDGKASSIAGMADTEALLISLCLFDENDKPVPPSIIEDWPNKLKERLFDDAKRISGIDQKKELPELLKERDELNTLIAKLQEEEKEGKKEPLSDTAAGSESAQP